MISKIFSMTIERPFRKVYEFVHNPMNMPQWAAGLCQSIQPLGKDWVAVTPIGPVKVQMAPDNDFGVCDHVVIPDPMVEIYVPMRVIANGEDASDVVFTLFRRPEMTDRQFAAEAQMVEQDLRALKAILEKNYP